MGRCGGGLWAEFYRSALEGGCTIKGGIGSPVGFPFNAIGCILRRRVSGLTSNALAVH